MIRRKRIELETGAVEARELTVGEISAWMQDMENAEGTVDFVDTLLLDNIRLSDLPRVTSLDQDDIAKLSQADLMALLEAVKELNPLFFAMLDRLLDAGKRLRET